MASQIPDRIIWKTNAYEILGFENADDETGLFDPKMYGLSPCMMHTACYRGFYCTYAIVDDTLYLDSLCVNDENGHYPPIHGIDAVPVRDIG